MPRNTETALVSFDPHPNTPTTEVVPSAGWYLAPTNDAKAHWFGAFSSRSGCGHVTASEVVAKVWPRRARCSECVRVAR